MRSSYYLLIILLQWSASGSTSFSFQAFLFHYTTLSAAVICLPVVIALRVTLVASKWTLFCVRPTEQELTRVLQLVVVQMSMLIIIILGPTHRHVHSHTLKKKMHVLRPLEAKSPIQAGARSDRKNGSPATIPGDNNIMFLIGNGYLKFS